jgi:hypothetical protein
MTLNAALAGVIIEIILVDLLPLFLTVVSVWFLWYVLQTIFLDEVGDPQFLLTFIIVAVPFVMLICFGVARLNYDAIAARFGRPTVLPLGPLPPHLPVTVVYYIGLTVWLWSRWRKL